MSRSRNRLLWIGLLLMAGLLAWRTVTHARTPPFDPSPVLPTPADSEVRGLSFTRATDAGELRVHAGELRPGFRTVGFFKLGISTHFELERLTVECFGPEGLRWTIHGRRARLDARAIRFRGRLLFALAGEKPTPRRDLEVRLQSGAVVASD